MCSEVLHKLHSYACENRAGQINLHEDEKISASGFMLKIMMLLMFILKSSCPLLHVDCFREAYVLNSFNF